MGMAMGHGVRTVQRCRSPLVSISSSFTSSRSTSMHACHEVQALSSIDLSKVHIDMSSSHISENLARTRAIPPPRVAELLLLRNGYRLQSSAHDNIWLRSHFQPAITQHGGKSPTARRAVLRTAVT